MDFEHRFTRIEEKLARQERLLQQLNDAVREQELRLQRLGDLVDSRGARSGADETGDSAA